MNPANLQLEGLYAAVAALAKALRDKGALEAAEIDQAFAAAEERLVGDRQRTGLSSANVEAIAFPLRFLRLANQTEAAGEELGFSELTSRVGRAKLR